jgi:cleavage stimulation factor subunit 1
VLAGTEHPILRLYDVNTFKCYCSNRTQEQHQGPINQVRYAPEGNIYASCAKDGHIKLWDAVTNHLINTIPKAHGGFEVSEIFSF